MLADQILPLADRDAAGGAWLRRRPSVDTKRLGSSSSTSATRRLARRRRRPLGPWHSGLLTTTRRRCKTTRC